MGGEGVTEALDYHDLSGRGKSAAFWELFGDECGEGWAPFFPRFQKDGQGNQEGCGSVGEDDGGDAEEEAVGEPEEHAGEIEDQHAVGEIASALFLDFDQLRDEGEGGAEAGDGAEDFDGLRGGHVLDVSWFYFSRRSGNGVLKGDEKDSRYVRR
jgi:hypothetical protein